MDHQCVLADIWGILLLGGRMGDLYGRRKLFIAGLFLFSLASLAGGLALSGVWLIITRGVQGLGQRLLRRQHYR